MIRSQGKHFSENELNRIVMLLRDTDMSLPEIADRMRCSRSAVAAINRKLQIRVYAGKRSQWTLNDCRSVELQIVEATHPGQNDDNDRRSVILSMESKTQILA